LPVIISEKVQPEKILTADAVSDAQIRAADNAGLQVLQSTLTSCVVNKPEDETVKCKIDKALEREGLAKSSDTLDLSRQDTAGRGCVKTPLWALVLVAATCAMAL
jgi:hypothetical protein